MEYLYHGSKENNLTSLTAFPSNLLNGEKVVFATQEKWLSLIFASGIKGDCIDFGFVNDIPYIQENKKGVFHQYMNTSGYIYLVESKYFKKDNRLGMQNHEFISLVDVDTVEKITIDNLLEEFDQVKPINLEFNHFKNDN